MEMYSLNHTGLKGCGYQKYRINKLEQPKIPQIPPSNQETEIKDFSPHKTK